MGCLWRSREDLPVPWLMVPTASPWYRPTAVCKEWSSVPSSRMLFAVGFDTNIMKRVARRFPSSRTWVAVTLTDMFSRYMRGIVPGPSGQQLQKAPAPLSSSFSSSSLPPLPLSVSL